MIQEDKELLLKDLCTRLPHHVRCKVWLKDGTTEEGPLDLQHNYGDVLRNAFYYNEIKDIKPYLRSMSSMTEEEFKDYNTLFYIHSDGETYCENWEWMDWMNAHHFDYRGLIEKGLAIAVTEEDNPYKK